MNENNISEVIIHPATSKTIETVPTQLPTQNQLSTTISEINGKLTLLFNTSKFIQFYFVLFN
jgi:hypothetical protein